MFKVLSGQGPRSKFLSGELNWTKLFFSGGGRGWIAWEFLFNFSKVTETAFVIFSDVAIGSQNSPSLNWNIIIIIITLIVKSSKGFS